MITSLTDFLIPCDTFFVSLSHIISLRAFLQSDPIQRDVFLKPPPELNLPRNKVLKLNKTAYGLVDASRAF